MNIKTIKENQKGSDKMVKLLKEEIRQNSKKERKKERKKESGK